MFSYMKGESYIGVKTCFKSYFLYSRHGRHSLTLLNIDTSSIGEYK